MYRYFPERLLKWDVAHHISLSRSVLVVYSEWVCLLSTPQISKDFCFAINRRLVFGVDVQCPNCSMPSKVPSKISVGLPVSLVMATVEDDLTSVVAARIDSTVVLDLCHLESLVFYCSFGPTDVGFRLTSDFNTPSTLWILAAFIGWHTIGKASLCTELSFVSGKLCNAGIFSKP